MKAVVVYESVFGNTHAIADAIGRGLASAGAQVTVIPVGAAEAAALEGADLLVTGGPTHAWSLSREMTRTGAVRDAREAGHADRLDPAADGPGLREWFDLLGEHPGLAAAAFDTRAEMRISGGAAPGIAKRLRKHGCRMVAVPAGFYVTGQDGPLKEGEEARAQTWAAGLVAAVGGVSAGG
jgi:hypothetical protein